RQLRLRRDAVGTHALSPRSVADTGVGGRPQRRGSARHAGPRGQHRGRRARAGVQPVDDAGRPAGAGGRDPRGGAARVLDAAVAHDPVAGFVADTVEDELAYVMENLGTDPTVMRRRVEDALDLLAIADLRHRALGTLSSGEAQRVAIASVITAAPRVLVLDEP